MGRLISSWIWESQFEPKTKNILWKKSIPTDGSVKFYKYNSGWQEITNYSDIKKPEFIVTPAVYIHKSTVQSAI